MGFRSSVLAASAMALAAAALLVGCGSPQEESELQNGGQPTPPQTALPAVDPDIALVEHHSTHKGYTLSYPEGWRVMAGEEFTDYFVWRAESGRTYAQVSISCRDPGDQASTPEQMVRFDAHAINELGAGRVSPSEATPLEVGGLPGRQLRYTHMLSGLKVQQVVAYAVSERCGWRISLAVYGDASMEPYLPLFQRIIATFRPD